MTIEYKVFFFPPPFEFLTLIELDVPLTFCDRDTFPL